MWTDMPKGTRGKGQKCPDCDWEGGSASGLAYHHKREHEKKAPKQAQKEVREEWKAARTPPNPVQESADVTEPKKEPKSEEKHAEGCECEKCFDAMLDETVEEVEE